MANVQLYTSNPQIAAHWTHVLTGEHQLSMLTSMRAEIGAELVLVDACKLDEDPSLLAIIASQPHCFLVIGSDWPEEQQVQVLVRGAVGYYDEAEEPDLLRVVDSVLNGDIWIRRALVPKVIDALIQSRKIEGGGTAEPVDIDDLLARVDTLSSREMEVADFIRQGQNNRTIAQELAISERTVKAHLSSIFKKLAVADRLHLAIMLKEIEHFGKEIS